MRAKMSRVISIMNVSAAIHANPDIQNAVQAINAWSEQNIKKSSPNSNALNGEASISAAITLSTVHALIINSTAIKNNPNPTIAYLADIGFIDQLLVLLGNTYLDGVADYWFDALSAHKSAFEELSGSRNQSYAQRVWRNFKNIAYSNWNKLFNSSYAYLLKKPVLALFAVATFVVASIFIGFIPTLLITFLSAPVASMLHAAFVCIRDRKIINAKEQMIDDGFELLKIKGKHGHLYLLSAILENAGDPEKSFEDALNKIVEETNPAKVVDPDNIQPVITSDEFRIALRALQLLYPQLRAKNLDKLDYDNHVEMYRAAFVRLGMRLGGFDFKTDLQEVTRFQDMLERIVGFNSKVCETDLMFNTLDANQVATPYKYTKNQLEIAVILATGVQNHALAKILKTKLADAIDTSKDEEIAQKINNAVNGLPDTTNDAALAQLLAAGSERVQVTDPLLFTVPQTSSQSRVNISAQGQVNAKRTSSPSTCAIS